MEMTMNKTFTALVGAASLAVALSACAETTGDGKPNAASQKESTGKAADKPAAKKNDNSSKGKGAIAWGNWQVVGKIQVKDDGIGSYDVKLRVKNTSGSKDTGIFTVNMLKGNTILGQADCTTPDIGPGEVGTANCFSTDDFKPGWTEITIEDSF
jgi:hypothetical protein